jgi:hypothetical protein
VQLPAQPLLSTAALVDEIVAMVDEQLQLAQRRSDRPQPPRIERRRPTDKLIRRVDRVPATRVEGRCQIRYG